MVLSIAPITAFAATDQEITLVDFGNVWKKLDSTQPVVFTTELNPNTDCPNQMEITSQAWIENESGASISSNEYPEAGKEYLYQITLTAKDGYIFPCQETGILFSGTVIIDGVDKTNDSLLVSIVSNDRKTLTVGGYPYLIAANGTSQDDYVINNVVIDNAPTSCTVGEAPKAMATKVDDESYTFYEYWEEWAVTEEGLEPVKFWYSNKDVPENQRITAFEEGKKYSYSIIAEANENYTFASQDNLSVTMNGEDFTDKSEVILDGTGLMIGPKFMTPKKPATPKEIELIKIYGSTISIWAGDEPEFTGTTLSDAPYVLVFEEWRTDGEWTRSDEWFNDADHHGDDKDITAFGKNKTYNYNLYIKHNSKGSEEGWCFGPNTKLKINGKEVSFTNNDPDVFMATTGITMTPTAAGASEQTTPTEGDKPEPIDSSEKFTDIAQGKWYKEYVDYVATYGLMNGMSENTFEPNTELSRAMFVQILANMNGVDTTDRAVETQFTDVPSGKWYTPAVKWAADEGIVNGISPTEFGPTEPIQRQQICVMLVRYAEQFEITLSAENDKKQFSDDDKIQNYAKNAVYICQQAGIVSGMTEDTFAPRNNATRAQIATFVTRFHRVAAD